MMHRFLFSEIKPMNKIVLYFMKDPHKKSINDNHKPCWNNSLGPTD